MFLLERTIVNGGILLAFGFTSLLCSLGGVFQHYFMIFATIVVVPYAYVLAEMKKNIFNAKYICLFIIFVFYNYSPIIEQSKVIYHNYSENGYGICTMRPLTMEKLKEIIIQNTNPTDKILVKGNQVSVYLYSKRKCATRFPFPLQWASLSKKHYVKDAEKALPKLIIQGEIVNSWDSFSLDSLLNDKYQLIETDIENVDIWKLKKSKNYNGENTACTM
jgi:hypothetical protein